MDGRICIGLSDSELQRLARAESVMKLSRRDLPYAVATGQLGATTVAATMICAHLAGIEVFVTGGIGGVHRGAETSFDISADLRSWRTPGRRGVRRAKAILDLSLTLEYLETHGVPVISAGNSTSPPSTSPDSWPPADFRLDTAEAQARFIRTQWALGLNAGVVVSNPVPDEAAMPRADMDRYIQQALQEAGQRGIHGKAVTPFLLTRIKELSGAEAWPPTSPWCSTTPWSAHASHGAPAIKWQRWLNTLSDGAVRLCS